MSEILTSGGYGQTKEKLRDLETRLAEIEKRTDLDPERLASVQRSYDMLAVGWEQVGVLARNMPLALVREFDLRTQIRGLQPGHPFHLRTPIHTSQIATASSRLLRASGRLGMNSWPT